MAKVYIANRPVRFDRNYNVGEVIPDGVITPQMGRKLTEMGRILHVDLPEANTAAQAPKDDTEDAGKATHSKAKKEQGTA